MRENPLLDLDLVGAAAAMQAGDIDPVALTEAYLARIAETEPTLGCYVTVDADGARAAAMSARAEIAAGRYRGPLHGIPVGVKDIFDTAGLRTTYGSIRYAHHVPTTDAVPVARLRSAGAVILGKQATHEFAWGGRTDNPHFGATHNPHDVTRIPGGSSGGGAASVVARSCLLALGSDTAGSVRIPAALCGCVGFKPARGWIDLAGTFPLCPELDHAGVLARTADDAFLAVDALSGRAESVGRHGGPRPRSRASRIGVLVGSSAAGVDAAVADGVADAVERLAGSGFPLVDVELPEVDERALAILTLIKAEAEKVHRAPYLAEPRCYGPDLAELLAGPPVSSAELSEARETVLAAMAALRHALGEVDVLVGATVPIVAPLIGAMQVRVRGKVLPIEPVLTRLTSVANAAGLPALSVPAPSRTHLPVGVQLLGRDDAAEAMREAARAMAGAFRAAPA